MYTVEHFDIKRKKKKENCAILFKHLLRENEAVLRLLPNVELSTDKNVSYYIEPEKW